MSCLVLHLCQSAFLLGVHGNIVETETSVTRTYLYITVNHKTAEEMADKYGFGNDQRKMLAQLLADENNSMWSAVLYGIGTASADVWNGVLVLYRGVPSNAAILKRV